MLKGGCQCGAVRYQAGNEYFHETNCHCTDCRGSSGAPFVAWLTVKRQQFSLVHGTPTSYASSASATRGFCPSCGTVLTFEDKRTPDEIDIAICSLDDPDQFPPRSHTFVRSRLAWVKLGDGLPEYEAERPD